jgi:putative ABC transport system ATP-binding protein
MNRDNQTTFIFSTHDPRVMEQAHRIIELVDGQIVHNGAGALPASA